MAANFKGPGGAPAFKEALSRFFSGPGACFWQETRWFQGKGAPVAKIEILDGAVLSPSPGRIGGPIWENALAQAPSEILLFLLCSVVFANKEREAEIYSLPLLLNFEAPLPTSYPLGEICFKDGKVFLTEAVSSCPYIETLGSLVASQAVVPGERGQFQFKKIKVPLPEVSLLKGEYSHTITLVAQKNVVKTFRRLRPGSHPDLEIAQALVEKNPPFLPFIWGYAAYFSNTGEEYTLATLQKFIPHAGTAWEFTLTWLTRNFYPACPEGKEGLLNYERQARQMGETIAFLHHTLATVPQPNFLAEEVTREDLAFWAGQMQIRLEEVKKALRQALPQLPEEVKRLAEDFLGRTLQLEETFRNFAELTLPLGKKCRGHLDLHLGQLLKTKKGFVVLDFEGEPLLRGTRRTKHLPLKDLAGMVRSFSYAALAGLLSYKESATTRKEVLGRAVEVELRRKGKAWARAAACAFLKAYGAKARALGSNLLPEEKGKFQAALQALILEKALYEVTYELNNRPSWLPIPLLTIFDSIFP